MIPLHRHSATPSPTRYAPVAEQLAHYTRWRHGHTRLARSSRSGGNASQCAPCCGMWHHVPAGTFRCCVVPRPREMHTLRLTLLAGQS